MSKSRGNVVNPDDVVTMYGADSLRLYEMFMGPLRDTKVKVSSEPHPLDLICVRDETDEQEHSECGRSRQHSRHAWSRQSASL